MIPRQWGQDGGGAEKVEGKRSTKGERASTGKKEKEKT